MSKSQSKNIAVIGAGSWGTALAIVLAKNEHEVFIWGRDESQIKAMQKHKRNDNYLPNVDLPHNLHIEGSLKDACKNADLILIAIPSTGFRQLLKELKPFNKPIIWATKGLENGSNKLLQHVIFEELGEIDCALLSGPSFAKEVATGLPTAVVIAANNKSFAEDVITLFANHHFRPYYSDDVTGVAVGGAVKNVMAIAAGISDGLGYGANARAALITRGLNEITKLGVALGANSETFMGLSGLGDLLLTCTDNQSRNRRFGLALGQGKNQTEAIKEIGQVVEGVHNVEQVLNLATEFQIDMPITKHIHQVLKGEISPQEAVESLFARDLKPE